MLIKRTKLKDVLFIMPESFSKGSGEVFADERGVFIEAYNEAKFKSQDIDIHFVEDDISVSKKDVLRGIHVNRKTWKLVSCLKGRAFYVVVDCNKDSKTFGKWESVELNDTNHLSILVPPMHGSSHLALTDTIIFYKQSTHYEPKDQLVYRWDEPKFDIKWPIKKPILSVKDASAEFIK